MDQNVFYIAGVALVALALIVSMIGLRSESFPSNGVLRAGVALMAAVVALTAAAAVSSSGEERDANAEASANAAELAGSRGETGGGAPATGTAAVDSAASNGQGDDTTASSGGATASDGATVFTSNGCGGCHTMKAAGSTGTVGPNLDVELAEDPPSAIRTSIVDPSAEIATGYEDIMPKDFGSRISPSDLDALVAYIAQSTHVKSPASGK